MHRVPTRIWQAIGQQKPPPTSRWGKAMADGQKAIDRLLAEVDKEHKAQGVGNSVSLAFESVAPLMVESDRIERYIRDTDAFDLMQVLVSVPTPETAAELADMEFRLEPVEKALLITLLEAEADLAERAEDEGANSGYALIVDGSHFREGLKRFRAMRNPRDRDRACFSFDGSFLSVDTLDYAFAARATGVWPGTASCAASTVAALAGVPPTGAEVAFAYEDGRLRIGTLTVAATWAPVSGALLALPSAPDWVEALSLKYRVHRSRLLHSGRLREVEAAEAKLTATISKAAKALAPLGVAEADIRQLVENVLAARWSGR